MTIPAGKTEYREEYKGIAIHGFSYTESDIKQSARKIADTCFDTSGKKAFRGFIASLGETGFNEDGLSSSNIKDWQVGEGFAEAYITEHFSCTFPWSNNRDLKNLNSSLTGADLVGFHQGKFAFGEVKTSKEQASPPQVTSKKADGLNAQLNKLCTDYELHLGLIQYLFYRQQNSTEYKTACKSYLQNNNNFHIFGVLVRNTNPTLNDWNYIKQHLTPHATDSVFLVGLYLPVNNDGIRQLHQYVLSHRGTS